MYCTSLDLNMCRLLLLTSTANFSSSKQYNVFAHLQEKHIFSHFQTNLSCACRLTQSSEQLRQADRVFFFFFYRIITPLNKNKLLCIMFQIYDLLSCPDAWRETFQTESTWSMTHIQRLPEEQRRGGDTGVSNDGKRRQGGIVGQGVRIWCAV